MSKPRARIVSDPGGIAITTRRGTRGLDALVRRFGPGVWCGGDGAPELDRSGSDPRRPWM